MLGPIQLRDDRGSVVEVPERKIRALVAALVSAGGQAVSVESLVDRVWGDSRPKHPARVLQAKLSRLRSLLDEASPGARKILHRSPAGYSLSGTPETSDVAEFRDMIRATSTQLSGQEQVSVLEQTLALWRGEPYAEFADQLWLAAEVGDLQEARLQAVERCAGTLAEIGNPERAVSYAAPHLAAHPARETLVAPLMTAYYRSHRQDEALAVYERLRRHLAQELGADPSPNLQDLHLRILRQDPDLEPALKAEAASQPASSADTAESTALTRQLPAYASPFMGRTEELGHVLGLLRCHRMVTLMGIGGIGKTRLAVETAEHALQESAAEVWFVDFTELSAYHQHDASLERIVACAVADALGIPTPRGETTDLTERIALSLQDRQALLILDNCEHVVAGVAPFAEKLLRKADSVRLLATSREPVALPEEQRYRVPQLPVVSGNSHQMDEPEDEPKGLSPAVDFFLARAQAVNSDLEVEHSTLVAAEQLCQQLDGLPLALELAAAQTHVLSVPELLERITDRLDLLARPGRAGPKRQQTLRGMLDWSWSLLSEEERTLLRRLGVHPASWRLDTIEEVCGTPCRETTPEAPAAQVEIPRGRILPLLSRLVDCSLVVTVKSGDTLRYRLLDTVHSYAAEKLRASGERPVVAARHGAYFRDLVECAQEYLFTPHAKGWLNRMAAERGHLTHALTEALRGKDGSNAASLAMSTFWFRWMSGRIDGLGEELAAVAACPLPEHGTAEHNRHAQVQVLARALAEEAPDVRADNVLAALENFTDDDAAQLARMQVQWFAASCLLANQGYRELGERLIDKAIEQLLAAGELSQAVVAATHRDYFLMDFWTIRPRGLPGGYDVESILVQSQDGFGRIQHLGVQYLVAVADGATSRVQEISEEAAQLAEQLGLEGELSYWESARTLTSLEAQDFDATQRHLRRAQEFGRRTAYAFCILHPDALEAALAHHQGNRQHAQTLLAGLSAEDRDTAHRILVRVLSDEALPTGLRLSGRIRS